MSNMQKRLTASLRASLSGYLLVFMAGGNGVSLYHKKSGRITPVPANTNRALSVCQLKWSIMNVVVCTERNGKRALDTDMYTFAQPYRHTFLVPFAASKHKELVDACKKPTLHTVGWIVCPHGLDIDEDTAFSVFEKLKAWDLSLEIGNENESK